MKWFLRLALTSAFILTHSLTTLACKSMEKSSLQTSSDRHNYPAHWWQEVPREGAPAWEILPQDAGPGEVILSKRNELGILSNFAPTPFTMDKVNYASVEGFWQSLKYPESENDERLKDPHVVWKFTRAQVQNMTAFEAKDAGNLANANMKQLGITWVTYQGKKINYLENSKGAFYQLVFRAMGLKLEQNAEVKNILLMTGDLVLKPDHKQSGTEAPAWKYFDIWMEYRDKLQESKISAL